MHGKINLLLYLLLSHSINGLWCLSFIVVDSSAQCFSECTKEHERIRDQETGEELLVEGGE